MTTTSFSYTGAFADFVVPTAVSSIAVDGYGAGVPGSSNNGARVQCTLPVTAGQTLRISIGGTASGAGLLTGGFNGGGNGLGTLEGGGGATDIRQGGTALANRVVVMGGGGGGNFGYGGYPTGATGGDNLPATGGTGGTQSAGGVGGSADGVAGSLGQGGNSAPLGGGGAGGGYYGGGGGGRTSDGSQASSGGGSSFTGSTVTGVTHTDNYSSATLAGAMTFTYTATVLKMTQAIVIL